MDLSLSTMAIAAVVIVVTGWLVQYARSRDAGSATESVAGTLGTLVLGAVTVLTVTLEQGAETLSLLGDLLMGFGPYLAHLLTVGLGWLGFSGRLELTPKTWVLVTVGILVVLVMFDRGR